MAIKTIGEQITNDRAIDLCIAAIEWAIEHSEQMTHDLIRGMGITSEELEDIGYEKEHFSSLHEAAVEEPEVIITIEEHVAAFKKRYKFDGHDNFEDAKVLKEIQEHIDICKAENEMPSEDEMANVVKEALYHAQYGNTFDPDDLTNINDYIKRFPCGR